MEVRPARSPPAVVTRRRNDEGTELALSAAPGNRRCKAAGIFLVVEKCKSTSPLGAKCTGSAKKKYITPPPPSV